MEIKFFEYCSLSFRFREAINDKKIKINSYKSLDRYYKLDNPS